MAFEYDTKKKASSFSMLNILNYPYLYWGIKWSIYWFIDFCVNSQEHWKETIQQYRKICFVLKLKSLIKITVSICRQFSAWRQRISVWYKFHMLFDTLLSRVTRKNLENIDIGLFILTIFLETAHWSRISSWQNPV